MNAEHTVRSAVRASRDSTSPDPGRSAGARLVAQNFGGCKAPSVCTMILGTRVTTPDGDQLCSGARLVALIGQKSAVGIAVRVESEGGGQI